jgi:hypothetical protein
MFNTDNSTGITISSLMDYRGISMIDVDWGNAQGTILIWTFSDDWVAQDFIDAFTISENAVAKMTRTSKPPNIHILLDVQHTVHLPKDMFTLGRYAIKRTVENRHKGLIVIINPSKIWNSFYDILKRTIPNSLKVHFAADADEAYQMMHEADMLVTESKQLEG